MEIEMQITATCFKRITTKRIGAAFADRNERYAVSANDTAYFYGYYGQKTARRPCTNFNIGEREASGLLYA